MAFKIPRLKALRHLGQQIVGGYKAGRKYRNFPLKERAGLATASVTGKLHSKGFPRNEVGQAASVSSGRKARVVKRAMLQKKVGRRVLGGALVGAVSSSYGVHKLNKHRKKKKSYHPVKHV